MCSCARRVYRSTDRAQETNCGPLQGCPPDSGTRVVFLRAAAEETEGWRAGS